jgi:GNAT superfamily N-acetyltransferase
MPDAYRLIDVASGDHWRAYHAIRRTVLWEAHGHAGYDENHPDDRMPHHYPLLLAFNGKLIGTTRIDDRRDGTGIIRLVAISEDHQRYGHGRHLSRLCDAYARRLEVGVLYVNAASEATSYYEKMGWHPHVWDLKELTGIVHGHVQMRKILS